MEAQSFENLRRFFERIKNVGFFERLFSWKTIVSLGYDAFGEYQNMQKIAQEKDQYIAEADTKIRDLNRDIQYQNQQIHQLQEDLTAEQNLIQNLNEKITEKERDRATLAESDAKNRSNLQQLREELGAEKIKNARLSEKYDQLNGQFTEAQKAIAGYQQKDENRQQEHDKRITELNTLSKQLEEDRLHLHQERETEIRMQYEKIEQTWKKHEEIVEMTLRNLCRKHNIDYCDKEKFPYSKKPDNSLVICDQYIIFDAKSPKNPEDLDNFPAYIKNQAEAVKKYVKNENVKNEVFLVVPANTVEYLNEFYYDMAEWKVYVVTHDCLEPIIIALRKIEDYEFAEQLNPEDRENLCRVIGRFAHAAKRRIQIDTYFCNEFINLLQGCSILPDEMKSKVVEYEKAEKMNPPMEKRKKLIPIKDIEHDVKVIKKEAEAHEIDVTALTKDKIDTLPLHKDLD
jgi:hypothetical protein